MRVCESEAQGPLPRDQEHVNPDKILEDPPRRWVLDASAFLVRKSRPLVLQHGADAVKFIPLSFWYDVPLTSRFTTVHIFSTK